MRPSILFTLLLAAPVSLAQFGDPPNELQRSVMDAMQSEIRTAQERARDRNRQPAEVLDFFRLEPGMTVIEILPAGGWYSKILGQILNEEGKLYVTHPAPTFYSNLFAGVTDLAGMEDVEELDWGTMASPDGTPWTASGPWDVEPVDMVLTFRNYHNFDFDARMAINKSSFDALKPGGLYGIVDHTRRIWNPTTPRMAGAWIPCPSSRKSRNPGSSWSITARCCGGPMTS